MRCRRGDEGVDKGGEDKRSRERRMTLGEDRRSRERSRERRMTLREGGRKLLAMLSRRRKRQQGCG